MSDLKNSILFLLVFIFAIFGFSQIDYVEKSIVNFDPIFYILCSLAVLSAILLIQFTNLSIYQYLIVWSVVYIVVRVVFWHKTAQLPFDVDVLEFVLVDIAAGLGYDFARQLSNLNHLLEKLTVTTYPNRSLDLRTAGDRINIELNRSRRYHRPLSLLLIYVDYIVSQNSTRRDDALQGDILARFAVARVGQLINDQIRQTDMIIRDTNSRFIILCPETEYSLATKLAERFSKSIAVSIGAAVQWGVASFPDEALTFDDLILTAKERFTTIPAEQIAESVANNPV
ncbi:MAG TPA: diguanylate cyclase [Anaerolineales bacterium]|jgi:GGDEF domain-containing protein